MARPRIPGDGESVHCWQAKIETGSRAVKPRVDLRLYRGLYSPFQPSPKWWNW